MNIYKNFLPKDVFKKLKHSMMGEWFPWYFTPVVNKKNNKDFQFTFTFLRNGQYECWGQWKDIMVLVLKNIKYKKIYRVKANLLTRTDEIIEHQYHRDGVPFSNTTGILYLDNSNGYTIFENGKKVSSEENKYVEFNSTLRHTGSTCTDQMRRMVINFNYKR